MAIKRDFLFLSAGRLISAFIALIAIRVVTVLLSPEQYGELSLLLTIQMFCGLFLVNPVGQHINLHTHSWWDDGTLIIRLKQYRAYIFLVSFIGLFIVLFMNKGASIDKLMLTSLAMFLMILAGTWNTTLIPILNMTGFRAASVLWAILTACGGLVFSIVFSLWVASATAWFLGQAMGMVIGWLGANYYLQKNAKSAITSKKFYPLLNKEVVLNYCLPLALSTGLMWLQLSGYRFLIERYWGLASLGFLVLGLQLAGQIWALIESLATQFLYPLFYRRVSQPKNQAVIVLAYSDLLNTLVPIYFVMTGLLIIGAPYLLKILVSGQYKGAISFVIFGAGIEMCRVFINLLSNAAHVVRNTKMLVPPYFVGAFVTLAAIYLAGVNSFDLKVAGGCLLAGSFAALISMFTLVHRKIKFSLDIGRCAVGFMFMIVMGCLAAMRGPLISDYFESLLMLIGIAFIGCTSIFALLKNNPATKRLLYVQLLKK